MNVLIADASSIMRRVMSAGILKILPKAKILEVTSGREACEALKAGSAEIAFIDMDLPDVNGAEAVTRAREEGARPFVTLMAQDIKPEWERWSRKIEAYELLGKPFGENQIRQIIVNYLRIKEPCRVLVVDDSKVFRHIIRKVLAGSRFALGVDVVDNSELAIGLLRKQAHEVVLLDYDMPGLDGLETACLLQEACPASRVIMISGSHDPTVEKAARYFGAVDFLRKPFYPADVDRALHVAFGLPAPSLLEGLDATPPIAAAG